MPTPPKKKLTTPLKTVLPTGTATSPPATVSEPSTSPGSAATTTSTAVLSLPPPDVSIPALPAGFAPVNLLDYRGSHPKAGQIAALPGAISELESSTSYGETFGSVVPPAMTLAGNLGNAAKWTALRLTLETFLVYVKSNEAVTWKLGLAELEQLDVVFQALVKKNGTLAAEFPALQRLLGVPKAIAQRSVATRARNLKAKALTTVSGPPATTPVASAAGPATSAGAAPSTVAIGAPVVNASGAAGAGGGAAH